MFEDNKNKNILPAEYYMIQLERVEKELARLKAENESLKRENLFLKEMSNRKLEEEYTD